MACVSTGWYETGICQQLAAQLAHHIGIWSLQYECYGDKTWHMVKDKRENTQQLLVKIRKNESVLRIEISFPCACVSTELSLTGGGEGGGRGEGVGCGTRGYLKHKCERTFSTHTKYISLIDKSLSPHIIWIKTSVKIKFTKSEVLSNSMVTFEVVYQISKWPMGQ